MTTFLTLYISIKEGKKVQSSKNLKQLILINCLIFAMINVACKQNKTKNLCLLLKKIISPDFFYFKLKDEGETKKLEEYKLT
jgi:hypothetical protein